MPQVRNRPLFELRPNYVPIKAKKERLVRNKLLMGMELETECQETVSREALAQAVINVDTKNVWTMHGDASLRNGVECVTHPMTFKFIKEEFDFAVVNRIAELGAPFTPRGRRTAGTHVHMSRAAFTPDQLKRFVMFHYEYPELCQRVAGRRSSEWASFAMSPYRTIEEQVTIRIERGGPRYTAVNLGNRHTIELRYFAGTTRVTRVMAYFEWAHALWAMAATSKPMTDMTVKAFLYSHAETYPNIIALLERKAGYAPERRQRAVRQVVGSAG
jgi:hypothetical protein